MLAKTKWKDAAFRNQKLNEWVAFARKKYGVDPPTMRSEWLSLFGFVFVALGLLVYSWKIA
jgi:hypothetical protein